MTEPSQGADPPSQADLVCLYFEAVEESQHADETRRSMGEPRLQRSVEGIGEALELDRERTTARLGLLSTLEDLQTEGLIESEQIAGVSGAARPVYRLTQAGKQRATQLRRSLRERTVTVVDGTPAEMRLGDLTQFFERYPLVRVATRLRSDGTVRVQGATTDGFVDRESELERLRDALSAAETHGGRTVLVAGEAGVGKTSLVERLLATAREADTRVAVGRCQRGGERPYGAIRDALQALPDGDALTAPLESAADTPIDDPEAFEAERTAAFNAVADRLRERATQAPVVVFLDDLQWAGEDTRRLFAHLTGEITEFIYPVLFVATYRSEAAATDEAFAATVDDLAARDRTDRVELGPLPPESSHGLVAWLTDRPDIPKRTLDALRDRTGGNPLFLRETVQQLLDEGAFDEELLDDGQSDATPGGDGCDDGEVTPGPLEISTPPDVTAVVESRLEALPGDTREILEATAVAGETVTPTVVASVTDREETVVSEHLDVLVTGRFLERTAAGVTFVGGVVRDVILDRIADGRRRRLHAAVADALAATDGEQAARIAHHYERAGEHAPALDWYRQAGDAAREVYAHEDAVDAYEAALGMARECGDDDAALDVLEALGETEAVLGRYEAARQHYAAARELATAVETRQHLYERTGRTFKDQSEFEAALEAAENGLALTGDNAVTDAPVDAEATPTATPAVAALLCVAADAQRKRGELDAARTVAAHARDAARAATERNDVQSTDARAQEASALRHLGNVADEQGDFAAARTFYEESHEIATEIGDKREVARALNGLGIVGIRQGDLETAADALEESLTRYREMNNRYGQTLPLHNLGLVATRSGNLDAATEYYEQSLAIERELGDEGGIASTLSNLGNIERKRGHFERAVDYYEQALEYEQRIGDRTGEANSLHNRGLIAIDRGNYETALEYLQRSLDIARDVGNRNAQARTLCLIGDVRKRLEDFAAAEEAYDESLSIAEAIGNPVQRGVTHIHRAELEFERDEYETAAQEVESGIAHVREAGDTHQEASGLAVRGRIARERGEIESAIEDFEAALAIAREDGYLREELDARARLAELHAARGHDETAREHCEAGLSQLSEANTDIDRVANSVAILREVSEGVGVDDAT
jgi:predicted ATPase